MNKKFKYHCFTMKCQNVIYSSNCNLRGQGEQKQPEDITHMAQRIQSLSLQYTEEEDKGR